MKFSKTAVEKSRKRQFIRPSNLDQNLAVSNDDKNIFLTGFYPTNQNGLNTKRYSYYHRSNASNGFPDLPCSPDQLKPINRLELFCDLSSIRGVQKIIRSRTAFIRFLWILFVISMTILLTVTSAYLVMDYLSYSTSWHTLRLLDDKTEFPSITLCAHNPFSLDVNKLWRARLVTSPRDLQTRRKQLLTTMLKHGMDNNHVANLAFSDSMEFYYTNLNPNDSFTVGHKMEMFHHCMVYEEGSIVLAEKCAIESEIPIQMRRFSHPKYFNCYTFDGKPNASTMDISRLIILIRIVPLRKIDGANSLFVMDTFTRGEGIKIVVHEKGTYPEIDKHGFNVQPGRMNEITYETVLWKRLRTPVSPCDDERPQILDFGINYTYRQPQCLDTVLQMESMRRCGCLNSEWPRPILSDKDLAKIPYCQKLPDNSTSFEGAELFRKRLDCFSSVSSEIKQIKEKAVRLKICVPRCTFYTYDARLSMTSWDPDPKRLELYTEGYRRVDRLLRESTNQNHIDNLMAYLSEPNSSTDVMSRLENSDSTDKIIDSAHTYISLIRQDFDTSMREERLVLDVNILISRIGGLCSLCIGLTTSFVIEIIEFIYLQFKFSSSYRNLKRKIPKTDHLQLNNSTAMFEQIQTEKLDNILCENPTNKQVECTCQTEVHTMDSSSSNYYKLKYSKSLPDICMNLK